MSQKNLKKRADDVQCIFPIHNITTDKPCLNPYAFKFITLYTFDLLSVKKVIKNLKAARFELAPVKTGA